MKNIIGSTGHQIRFDNITHSDNCFIFDNHGNKFIDLESGVWCTSVGHNNKRINNAITTQINKICHTGFCYCHPQLDVTAQKILETTGIINGKCEFLCSGSEAVEYGMRLARTVSSKPLALTFSDSYCGAFGDASVKDNSKWHIFNWLQCDCKADNTGCQGKCESFKSIPFEKIGIFVFEPGSSSGLVRFPSQSLVKKIVHAVRAQGGIILCNEITTGMGRTGKWFGYQHYDFTPDIVAIGKGLGNGYPVSAAAVANSVLELAEDLNFRYSQSHQNDPLGAIVAAEVFSIIEDEDLLNKCNLLENYIKESIQGTIQKHSIVKEVRGRGLMLAIEFHKDAHRVFEELLKRGIILAKRPNAEVLRLDPALTIDLPTIDFFLCAFKEIIEEI